MVFLQSVSFLGESLRTVRLPFRQHLREEVIIYIELAPFSGSLQLLWEGQIDNADKIVFDLCLLHELTILPLTQIQVINHQNLRPLTYLVAKFSEILFVDILN